MTSKLEELQKLVEQTETKRKEIERTVYYDDFIKAFKALMKFIDNAKTELQSEIREEIKQFDSLHQRVDNIRKSIEERYQTGLTEISNELKSDQRTFQRLVTEDTNEANDLKKKLQQQYENKISDISNELKSDQRTFQRLIDEKIKFFEDSIPDDYDDELIIEDLKTLNERLDSLMLSNEKIIIEMKENLDKNSNEIEELKKRPIATGGNGRITDMAIQSAMNRIVKQEALTGTIDGVNDTFTVNGTIHAVLSFELGSRVVSLGTYSITGSYRKTIVFDNPIPANYSDDSFTITYV